MVKKQNMIRNVFSRLVKRFDRLVGMERLDPQSLSAHPLSAAFFSELDRLLGDLVVCDESHGYWCRYSSVDTSSKEGVSVFVFLEFISGQVEVLIGEGEDDLFDVDLLARFSIGDPAWRCPRIAFAKDTVGAARQTADLIVTYCLPVMEVWRLSCQQLETMRAERRAAAIRYYQQ